MMVKGVLPQRGVTLVELLVTIVLVGILFAAAVPLFVFAQQQSSGDRARVIAANVAQSELEVMRSVAYGDLTEEEETYAWPNDLGGPVKVYSVTRATTFVHEIPDDPESPVIYKMVTVDVSWTPPPRPVKHVVLKTAIYPQYRGPVIVDMTVGPLTEVVEGEFMLQTLPVLVSVQIDTVDIPNTEYLRIAVSATNGSYSDYVDLPADQADEEGWFTWSWSGLGAGDGDYTFTAVAVTPDDRLGEPWLLTYMLDTGPPGAPTGLDVRPGDGIVSVRWSPPSPVAGDLHHYVVRRSDGETVAFTSPTSTSTTFIDRQVTQGVSYTYTVAAVDEVGRESAPSAPASATPGPQPDSVAPGDPASPTGLTAVLLGQSVTLNWTSSTSPDVTDYMVYRLDDAGLNWPIAVIPVAPGQMAYTYSDPEIGWDVRRTYLVRAVDAALNESAEVVSQEVISAAEPPSEAFGLTIKVTGNDAIVMVASLIDGSVYDINGDRLVDDKTVSPILVKSNQKQGVTFRNLNYSDYRVTVVFVDAQRNPISEPRSRDVELVRNETITFAF